MTNIREDECEALWHAVLKQAIFDAQSIDMWTERMAMYNKRFHGAETQSSLQAARNGYMAARTEHRECVAARRWLLQPNEDFNWVCGVLGLDPVETRALIKEILDGDLTKVYGPMTSIVSVRS